uniref:Poly(ADP-ribose) polymerase family member 4 n=2 Tax=Dromaius novaehollandiae TaxID=8790 RepID=A0A8C4KJJ4_DRONO
MGQGFTEAPELDSLKLNLSFYTDFTKETSLGTRSSSPDELPLLHTDEGSLFGSKPEAKARFTHTRRKSRQMSAFRKLGTCADVPELPCLSPLPCLPPVCGQLGHAPVAQIQHSGLFGSPTPLGATSEKNNFEKLVTPRLPGFQACQRAALPSAPPLAGSLPSAVVRNGVMASERGFTEGVKNVCFLTAQKEIIKQKSLTSVNWNEIFDLQNQDGSWNLSPQLGKILKFDVDYLINDFLIGKGIQSLGKNGKEKILQLIATLLVLQFIRCTQQLKGIVFKSLMKLDDLSTSSTVHWAFELIKKAVEWVRRVERRFPAICYRLELGKDWDSATRKILGIKFN